jgi:DNA-binding transcriptional LysR family regulator
LDSDDLAVFLAAAEAGSVGRAAAHLHVVQSAVTTRLRKMEDGLGVRLFRRHARGVTLTAEGETLLPYARQITRLIAEARHAVTDSKMPRGRLAIGAIETATALRLGQRLAAFARSFPDVELTIRTGTTPEMVTRVLRQELEAAFVCGPVAHAQLIVQSVVTERLMVVAPPGIASLDAAIASDQVRILVLRQGCSYRQRLEDLLTRRGVAVVQVLEYGTVDAILACASAGMGLTLLPAALLDQWGSRHAVSLFGLVGSEGEADTVLIRRAQSYVSPALQAFLNGLSSAGTNPPVARLRGLTSDAAGESDQGGQAGRFPEAAE